MLQLNKDIFRVLEDNNIQYCHWKSNSHLDKALIGKTDIDILVSEKDWEKFESVLENFDFIKIQTPKIKSTYKVYDFIGFDKESTNLTHFHVHYVVVLGEKYVKNYFIPIEESFLTNNSVKFNVRIPNPNLELLILIIRMHIKLDWFDFVMYSRCKQIFPKQIFSEFISLNETFEKDSFSEYASKVFSDEYLKKILNINSKLISGDYSIWKAFRNKYLFKKGLKKYRRKKGIRFYFKKLFLSFRYFKYVQRIKRPRKKSLMNNSISIAFIGADGSGKSTVTKDIIKWLSWKVAVKGLYLGIPKKSPILKIISLQRKIITKGLSVLGSKASERGRNFFNKTQWLFVAYKRNKIGRYIKKTSPKGSVFIIDRYPLDCFDQMSEPMDRPRIKKINKKSNWLSSVEEKYYESIPKPDKKFVLRADIDTLRSRKTDIQLEKHIEKANAVNSIQADKNTIIIDATMPYNDVLIQVKTKIWEVLNENH